MRRNGRIVVVSAPSGAGKSTLIRMAQRQLPNLVFSVSATTRHPRGDEKEGTDYYFITEEEFRKGIDSGAFAEWAEVHGNLYGTYKSEIERHLQGDNILILELDVQGMRSIKTLYPQALSVFIAPPNMETLRQRLQRRGTNTDADIELRLKNAEREMTAANEFDVIIVNDVLENAVSELVATLTKIEHTIGGGLS